MTDQEVGNAGSIQILGLREGKGRCFYEYNWRAESVQELFANIDYYLEKIPEEMRWNLFFTVAHCFEENKLFESQDVIAFDIDNIDMAKKDGYIPLICQVLGLDYSSTAFVISGNGIHFYIQLTRPFTDDNFFKLWKEGYIEVCRTLNEAFKQEGLVAKITYTDENGIVKEKVTNADSDIWDRRRIMRLPGTINRKANRVDTFCRLIQPNLEKSTFELKVIGHSELAKKEYDTVINFPPVHVESVLRECLYLQHCKENPAKISEPQWKAFIGAVAFMPDGPKLCHDMSKGHPDYNYKECQSKIDKTLEFQRGPRTCKDINSRWDGCKECIHYRKLTTPLQIDDIKTKSTGFHNVIENADGKTKLIPNYEDLRRFYERQHLYITTKDTKTTSIWNGHHWEDVYEAEIKAFAREHFRPMTADKNWEEFSKVIRITNLKSNQWFTDSIEKTMNLSNGILDLKTMQLIPHSPKYGHKRIQDYPYDINATCPIFDNFMSEITLGDKEVQAMLLEFMGYALFSHPCDPPNALVLVGDGANGKTTFLRLLRGLAGEGGYSVVPMDALNDPNSRSLLVGKLFNVREETPGKALLDSEDFKDLVGGGKSIGKFLFKDKFEFVNRAKFIFASNEMPSTYDTSFGMERRMLIAPFDAVFKHAQSEGANRAEQKPDHKMLDKLLAERPGILNKVASAYANFCKNNTFTESRRVQEKIEEFTLNSNPVRLWLEDMCELKPIYDPAGKDFVTKFQAFTAFNEYCIARSMKHILNEPRFCRAMLRIIKDKERMPRRIVDGRKLGVIYGLDLYKQFGSVKKKVNDSYALY